MSRSTVVLLVLAALTAAPPAAAQRELHWKELAVHARLAADGTLVVSEIQRMVFTGDWNGGERGFRLGLGQQLTLDRVSRLDPASGEWLPLRKGSLAKVDEWKMTDARTLRWRSRLPSDPPFAATELDYRIDYRLTGILKGRGEAWRLDHDFVFPDRAGEIQRFTLDLELAPEWNAPATLPRHLESGPLSPGESQVVTADLRHTGAPPARAGLRQLPLALRAAVLGGAALGTLVLIGLAVRGERALGRLLPLAPDDAVDRAWIERHVLALLPEEVGAAWDDKVGAAEVAAMLARLQLEGKITSRIETAGFLVFERQVLHMTLTTARDKLQPAERKLISGFFFAGDSTDTDSLRAHYRTSGFDPAGKIRDALFGQLRRRSDFATTRPRPSRQPGMLLVLAGLAGLLLAIPSPPAGPLPVLVALVVVLLWLPAIIGARVLRDRVTGFVGPAVAIAVGLVDPLLALTLFATLPMMNALTLVAGALLYLGLARAVSTAMQSREGAPTIAHRRELARGRRWFESELGKEKPALEDAWLPYLIAFGLAPQMDRWFRAFGGAAAMTSMASGGSSGGFGGGSSSSGGGWTGGGGSFGGAGATASWTAAATAMSAGVAAASSGGGSGGGGGGGGSSGGGSGGGW